MSRLDIVVTPQFKKDFRLIKRQHLDVKLLHEVVQMLADGKKLPLKYKDHALKGKWKPYRECHIQPDWLLIYYKDSNTLVLTLSRTGTHSDLF